MMHPLELRGWLFDLDGVLTDTARVHVEAWKETFDELLGRLSSSGEAGSSSPEAGSSSGEVGSSSDEAGRPFDPVADYERYVDGKARRDGVRDFLASRGIVLVEGGPDDPAEADTVWGVGKRKNARFLELLDEQGVETFPGSARLVRELVHAGRCTGVVSASENCRAVLEACGMSGLFHVVVDGLVANEHGLAGKPAPDTYLFGASMLHLLPVHVAVVEDAPAGVAAGRAGGFGYVIGVARRASGGELLEAGADVVVHDLGEFEELLELLPRWGRASAPARRGA
jgi:HAD superfamily hydrolase (TIGR01509 family)